MDLVDKQLGRVANKIKDGIGVVPREPLVEESPEMSAVGRIAVECDTSTGSCCRDTCCTSGGS